MKCPICAVDNGEEAKRCTACGTPFESRFKVFFHETKWILLVFAILAIISFPFCAFLGYRTNWIL